VRKTFERIRREQQRVEQERQNVADEYGSAKVVARITHRNRGTP
jgi:hypothetical protein